MQGEYPCTDGVERSDGRSLFHLGATRREQGIHDWYYDRCGKQQAQTLEPKRQRTAQSIKIKDVFGNGASPDRTN